MERFRGVSMCRLGAYLAWFKWTRGFAPAGGGEAARARDEAGGAGHLRHQVARLQERAVPFYGLLDKENCVIARLFPMLRRRLNMA